MFEIQTPFTPIVHPKMNSGNEFPSAFALLFKWHSFQLLQRFLRRETVEFDHLVPRLVATHQFNAATGAIQFPGQQFNQRFVRRGIHRRRSNFDSQFIAKRFTNFID